MVVVCAVAFILSIIVSIYVFGLRDKWEGEGDSAYSLFNPGARAIPGGRSLPFSAQIFSCGRNPFHFQPICLTALPKHANDACAYQAPRTYTCRAHILSADCLVSHPHPGLTAQQWDAQLRGGIAAHTHDEVSVQSRGFVGGFGRAGASSTQPKGASVGKVSGEGSEAESTLRRAAAAAAAERRMRSSSEGNAT